MSVIKADERKGVWMRVPIELSNAIQFAAKHGFQYHHAEGQSAMLLKWLPDDEPCPVPAFATHVIGVGGLVVNASNEACCVIVHARFVAFLE